MSDGPVEELKVSVTGDMTSLDDTLTRGEKRVDDFVQSVAQHGNQLATIIKQIDASVGTGLTNVTQIGQSVTSAIGASDAAIKRFEDAVDRFASKTTKGAKDGAESVRRVNAEYKAGTIDMEQRKARLQQIADTEKKGSAAQLAALAQLRSIREQEAHAADQAAKAKAKEAATAERAAKSATAAAEKEAKASQQVKKDVEDSTVAVQRLELEYKAKMIPTLEAYKAKLKEVADASREGSNQQLAANAKIAQIEGQEARQKNAGSPLAKWILSSRYQMPGADAQPLVGATTGAMGLSGNMAAGAALVGGVTAAVGAMAIDQAKEAVRLAADLEQSLNVLQQQSGATDAQMEELRKTAQDLGGDITLPATSSMDAASAMLELSKAGLSVQDSMDGARGSLQLAAAGQISAGEAANIVASQLMAFKLAGTEASRVADLLAATANNSLGDIGDMAQAAQQAGTAFSQAKIPIQDMYTAIGLMANAGIKGSDAGTSLRVMLTRIQAPTDEAKKLMDGLGMKIYDAQGKFVGIRSVIAQFESKLKDATDQQKKQIAQIIFGEDAQRAFNVVLAGGVKQYDDMAKKVQEQGAAAANAAAQNKGLKGSIDGLKSAWESFLEKQGKPVLDWLTKVVQGTSAAINKLDEWIDKLKGAKDAQAEQAGSSGIHSLRLRAEATREQIKGLYRIKAGQDASPRTSQQEQAAMSGVRKAGDLARKFPGIPGAGLISGASDLITGVAGNSVVQRTRALHDAGLSPTASDADIDKKIAEMNASARADEETARKLEAQAAKRKPAPKPKATTGGGGGGGKGDPLLQALLDSLKGGKKHGGGGSVPSYLDVPETIALPERSGKRSYEDHLQDIEDGFAKVRAEASKSGTALNEHDLAVERLQKRLAVAGNTIEDTKKKIATLTPTVKAQENTFIAAATAYKAYAEPLAKRMLAGYKPSASEVKQVASLRRAREAAETQYNPNKQLLSALEATSHAAGRQQSDDTVALAKEQTDYQSKQREGFLNKQKADLDKGVLTTPAYESVLKDAMARILEKDGAAAINGEDYKAYGKALNDSQAARANLTESIQQKTKGDTKSERIKALDAEVAEMRRKGADEVAVTDYYNDQLTKINQKYFADTQRDTLEDAKWQMEQGTKTRAQYRDLLVSSLEETRRVFGDTSKEAAQLNMEILRLDWQGVEDDAREFKEELDSGDISIRQYQEALRGLQTQVSESSAPWRSLQKEIDETSKKMLDAKRKTADDIGGRVGDAVVAILRKKSSIAQVIKDTINDAVDDAIKDGVKRSVSKLAMKFLGLGEAKSAAQQAADLQNQAGDKQLEAAEKNLAAATAAASSAGATAGAGAAVGGIGAVAPTIAGISSLMSANGAASKTGDLIGKMRSGADQLGSLAKNAGGILGKAKASGIGSLASGLSKYLGYAGAAYAGFELVKGLFATQERGFKSSDGQSRYANLGSGDHTGLIDSGYSGTDGMRQLQRANAAARNRAQSIQANTTIHPGAIVINAQPHHDAQAIAHEVITQLGKITARENAFTGFG